MTVALQKPHKVRVLAHPRAPGVRVVQFSDATFVLYRADGTRLSARGSAILVGSRVGDGDPNPLLQVGRQRSSLWRKTC
jgi:hypothetical protein